MTDSISEFERHWTRFTQGLGPIQDLVRREIARSGESAQAAQDVRRDGLVASRGADPEEDYVEARRTAGQLTLLGPLGEWERRQPIRRAVLAFDDYRRALDDQVRRAPERIRVRGEDLAAVLRPLSGDVRFFRIWGRGTKLRAIPFRNLIHRGIASVEGPRLLLQQRFLFTLARSLDTLASGWSGARHELDVRASGRGGDRGGGRAPGEASHDHHYVTLQARAVLAEWDRLAEALPRAVARTITAGIFWPRKIAPAAEEDAPGRQIEHWTQNLRLIDGELGFQKDLLAVEQELLRRCTEGCDSAAAERRGLLDRIEAMAASLSERMAEGGAAEALPVDVPRVASANSRRDELYSHVRAAVDSLPADLRLVKPVEPSRDRALGWRSLGAARLARDTFDKVARPEFDSLFTRVHTEHVALARKIDQALEIVDYGAEAHEGSDPAENAAVAQESVANALGLLEAEKQSAAPDLERERRLALGALARFFVEYHLVLQCSRLGALARVRALGLRRSLTSGHRSTVRSLLFWAKRTGRGAIWLYRRFLITIHWMPPEESRASEIVRRPCLSRDLVADLGDLEIPSIYRRLFRFEPVTDPRFLIGRDEELAAIAEVRALWDNGRPVAVLIVGSRGSGKTSLINCALAASFPGLEVLRGRFSDRVVDAAGLRHSLVASLGLSDPDGIEAELGAERRIVVLDDIERAFLREIGGFGAVRELQRIIATTYRTTLWVIACNQRAYNLLDRVVSLGEGFSHRIDTASVSGQSLREAIMVRHDLSGLSLEFLPPPESAMSSLLHRAGVRRDADPEQSFFQRLEEESAGVFRAAFETWLGQSEWVPPSLLRVNPLVGPDVESMMADLDREDLFTLLAVMQHGSLTTDEHARIFRQSAAQSRADMDDLIARELIEPDPLCPGHRVRTSAMRLTREALYRRNLS